MHEPMVSIVIPTFNSAKTIAKALESLRSIDYSNYEIIIVDGGSYDGTLEIVRKFGVNKIVVERRRGRGVAYNTGLLKAKGKYVAFLDSDAFVGTPSWIANAVNVMEKDSKVAVVFTKVYAPPDASFLQKAIDTFLCKGFTTANGAVYRKDVVIGVGGFNERMNYMQEDELLYRLLKAGYKYHVNLSDKIFHYHRNSIKAYIRQNIEAGEGSKIYYRLTRDRRALIDSLTRICSLIISALLLLTATFSPWSLLLLPAGYLFVLVKVIKETHPIYKCSKYVLFSPFLIYLSLIGFTIGYLKESLKNAHVLHNK
ncbi:MAG: glycosyltransferase family 2 protein [Candidatus Korarchaeota archaeon]|nr:glycosyltransferase [Thermoproteota archaeon]